ncbi:virulence-associated E family protein [Novosphingobium sp. JCM 18896]|nr:virulence-associated E family protein [Novosphingobium sp. JCM 18896]
MTIENVEHLLQETGLKTRFDVIKKRVEVRWSDGSQASENDIVSIANLNHVSGQWLQAFIYEIANRNRYNPVADWISTKERDRIDRLPEFCATIQAAEEYPTELKAALLHRWMLSVAAAATRPGRVCCRGVLTLQGPQGIGKTSWVASLLPAGHLRESFIKRDHHLDATSKDSILGAVSHLITEIGELDSSFRKDVARLKGFLTNDCDKLRPPYARSEVEFDRKTVFAATVNDGNFLVDSTGNTRFWTIAVERLDYQHGIDLQQLYAQLAAELADGAQWWLTADEDQALGVYNLRHRSVSAIEERLADFVDHERIGRDEGAYMTAIQVLKQMGVANPSNRQCKECGSALRDLLGDPKRVRGRDRWRVPIAVDEDPSVATLNYPVAASRYAPEDRF